MSVIVPTFAAECDRLARQFPNWTPEQVESYARTLIEFFEAVKRIEES